MLGPNSLSVDGFPQDLDFRDDFVFPGSISFETALIDEHNSRAHGIFNKVLGHAIVLEHFDAIWTDFMHSER